MPETFLLIPVRTSRQGTALNEGKYTPNYIDETKILSVALSDMTRLGLANGDRVRLRSEETGGTAELVVTGVKDADSPPGMFFLPYGDASSRLMAADTHGTGMPTSKCFEVTLEKLP